MLPPLLRVLLAQPTLLTGYASAYAALLRQDAAGWQARQPHKLGYLLAAAGAGVLAVLFAGVALMLYAVTGGGHWLLWAVPAAALLTAIVAAWRLARVSQTAPAFPFPRVREQLAQDRLLFGLPQIRRFHPSRALYAIVVMIVVGIVWIPAAEVKQAERYERRPAAEQPAPGKTAVPAEEAPAASEPWTPTRTGPKSIRVDLSTNIGIV